MSVFASVATDPSVQLHAEGIIRWINDKGTDTSEAIRTWTIVGCMGLVGVTAVTSRFALGKVLGTGFVAAIVLMLVFNMTKVQEKATDEIEGLGTGPAVVQVLDKA